ncbi:MAG: sugar phosphate isomerase/epimerase [Oscillospiraceae bacterium]|nr:sugar phosphate isomerase/epimerase [Oscillospiraceae bacterium]
MKYSISNIAWDKAHDFEMYTFLQSVGMDGIEIAPTRLFENPYENLEQAQLYATMLFNRFGLSISSMQSIWYGKSGNIFNKEEAKALSDYTKKAMDFANATGIKNLVFGCPKNRSIPEGAKEDDVLEFFYDLGEYAKSCNTVLALEANPVIYNTNFMNTTTQAAEFCKKVGSEGVKLNVDFGTILYNKENPHVIKTYKNLVNHIHLSVPQLRYVEKIKEHGTLKKVLGKIDYDGYLSIEMGNVGDTEKVKQAVIYLKENF